MGMFDWVELKGMICPYCGARLDNEWQTKDLDNELEWYTIKKLKELSKNGTYSPLYINVLQLCENPKCEAAVRLSVFYDDYIKTEKLRLKRR